MNADKRTRSLFIETLESRCLLSADWPADVGFHADLFVDGGAHLSQIKSYAAAAIGLTQEGLYTSSHAKTKATFGGTADDLNGVLLYPDGQPRYRAIFVNGGNAIHGLYMGAAGRNALVEFVHGGGSYVGSCAGAYLIRKGSYYPGLWDGKMGNNNGRSGYMTVDLTDTPVMPYLQALGSDAVIPNVQHFYGPVFRETYRHPEETEFLGTITSTSYSIRNSRGTPYLIVYEPEEEYGRIVVQPSHPEYARSGERMLLSAALLQYAMDGSQAEPDLKGELQLGGSVLNEKVGDGQYHRYTVQVPAGTTQLKIDLTGLSADCDMFVQYGTPAHPESYFSKSVTDRDESVTIDAPAAGTWHVSVYGAHEILNGATYTVEANIEAMDVVFAQWKPQVESPAPEVVPDDIPVVPGFSSVAFFQSKPRIKPLA